MCVGGMCGRPPPGLARTSQKEGMQPRASSRQEARPALPAGVTSLPWLRALEPLGGRLMPVTASLSNAPDARVHLASVYHAQHCQLSLLRAAKPCLLRQVCQAAW